MLCGVSGWPVRTIRCGACCLRSTAAGRSTWSRIAATLKTYGARWGRSARCGGLAPGKATQRALFFVLTGQRAQHRAEDPDGSLLAEAYREAREEQRAAVRQALAGADDLDLVRVIAGAGRGAVAAVTPWEASYLGGQFAVRRDWAGLLQFALGLPLAAAATGSAASVKVPATVQPSL